MSLTLGTTLYWSSRPATVPLAGFDPLDLFIVTEIVALELPLRLYERARFSLPSK